MDLPQDGNPALELFGEGTSRVLISFVPENLGRVKDLAREHNILLSELGAVSGDALIINSGGDIILKLKLAAIKKAYEEVFPCLMD